MKLVNSEYEHPSARATVGGAREYFLDAVSDFAPEVIDDLHGKPFKSFLQTGIAKLDLSHNHLYNRGTYRNISRFWRSFENESQSCVYFTPSTVEMRFLHDSCEQRTRAKLKELVSEGVLDDIYFMFEPSFRHFLPCPTMVCLWKSLQAWSRKHSLCPQGNTNWCLKSAFHTLDFWARGPVKYDEIGLLYYDTSKSPPRLKSPAVPLGFNEWQPEFQERRDYLNDVVTNLKTELREITLFENAKLLAQVNNIVLVKAEEYCDRVAQYYRSNGWEKVRDKKKFEKHLEWTVKFQVRGDGFSSIANLSDVSVPTVKKEVEKCLDLIGLKRRVGVRPGPRVGQKQSPTAGFLRRLGR